MLLYHQYPAITSWNFAKEALTTYHQPNTPSHYSSNDYPTPPAPLNLILIPIPRTGNLLRMELLKPRRLPEIRSLSTHLEMQPLLDKILLRGFRVCQRIGGVIRIDQVFYDRAGFPESDACVWVFDCGDADRWG